VLVLTATAAAVWAADAKNGAVVLENQSCLECHTVQGQGSGHEPNPVAVELGDRLTTTYTAAALASVLWNHTPAMWDRMFAESIARPVATESDWRDVFAYLYSLRFSEPPAEFRRGRELLTSKHCADCHGGAGPGKPVAVWEHVEDPVMLVYLMWNHAPAMQKEIAANKKQWVALTGRDFLDLTAYVQDLHKVAPNRQFSLPDPEGGQGLFESHCARCHRGANSLATRLRNKTWADIGAAMWNHAPAMLAVPAVLADDMRKIMAYVWELQYQGPEGSADRGHKVFNEKRCIVCHKGSPAPGKIFTASSMVALGWGPGRQMHQKMIAQGIAWPYLSPADMANLVAYLNKLP
jgi:mono/diheme cytochrome c family protein